MPALCRYSSGYAKPNTAGPRWYESAAGYGDQGSDSDGDRY